MHHPLIQADQLHLALASAEPPLVFDCRFRLGQPDAGFQLWREGHIPGSQHLDLDRHLSAIGQGGGRHPLPSEADFSATLQHFGVHAQRPVVVLDDMGGQLAAARAWWMLKHWAGHPRVQLLDGGLSAWQAMDGELESGDGEMPSVSDWIPTFSRDVLREIDAVASSSALKIDARPADRFRGEQEAMDPRPGHIPGALNRPCADNLDANGRFKDVAQLDAELPRADDVIAYCGSGVTACHNILAWQLAGRPLPRLYVGSWSEWSQDSARPAELG